MKPHSCHILHLEDDPATLRLVRDLVRQVSPDCHLHVTESIPAFSAAFSSQNWDLVLADCRLAHADEWRSLDLVQQRCEKIPYLIISDSMSEEFAIDGLQRGAWDYLLKSNLRDLPHAILRARDYFREKQLQKAEEKSRWHARLLDLTNEAIFVRDAFDMIVYWNEGAEKLYGWTAQEALGKRSRHLLRTASPRLDWSAIADECNRTGHWEGELIRHHRNGSKVTVASRWTLHSHPNPSHAEIVEVDSDQAPIKVIEERFYQAQKAQVLSSLAGGMAHNFNNVLAAFQAALGILKLTGHRTEEMSTLNEILESSVERGTTLVRQMAMLANQATSSLSDVDLNERVYEVVSTVQQTFSKKIIAQFRRTEALPMIRGDSAKINQVLLNLCLNARDAFPESGGIIKLTTHAIQSRDLPREMDGLKGKEYICVTVEDTGKGMTKEQVAKILEPFFTTTTSERCHGLGLQAVYGIVREHEGFITISSSLGHGTKVSVYFPATLRATGFSSRLSRMTILPASASN